MIGGGGIPEWRGAWKFFQCLKRFKSFKFNPDSGTSCSPRFLHLFVSSVFTVLCAQKSGNSPPQAPSFRRRKATTFHHCQDHDCAKKKGSCSKNRQRTEAKKEACSLKTGSQQALFPHGELKHLRIPPHIHFRACRSFMASSCGTVWKNLSSSLRARAIAACSNSSSGWRPRVHFCRFRRQHFLGSSVPLVDALLNQGLKHLEAGPDTQPWC